LLNNYRWKNRIIVILSKDDKLIQKQKKIFDKSLEGILERDVIIFGVEKNTVPYIKLNHSYLNSIKKEFNLGIDDKIVLFGKDGSIKGSWKEPITAEKLFKLIDSMPMRKAEMQKK
jgi:hypothetical protein